MLTQKFAVNEACDIDIVQSMRSEKFILYSKQPEDLERRHRRVPIDPLRVDEVDPQRVYGASSVIYGSIILALKRNYGGGTHLSPRFQVRENERRGGG